jgi:hypothetical protein
VAEIRGLEREVAEGPADGGQLLVRHFEECFEEAELVENFEGGGMDGIAAEVAKEIVVLLEDADGDPGAGQKVAEHDARRASTDYAAGGFQGFSGHTL